MEPVTTTAMIGTVVGYVAKKLKDNKSVQDFFSDFVGATVDWIRPLFLKDENTYEKIIEDLLKNPESPSKRGQVEMALASHVEDNPNDLAFLKELYIKIKEKEGSNLDVGHLTAMGDIAVKVKQEKSSATLKDMKSQEGKINIDLDQK